MICQTFGLYVSSLFDFENLFFFKMDDDFIWYYFGCEHSINQGAGNKLVFKFIFIVYIVLSLWVFIYIYLVSFEVIRGSFRVSFHFLEIIIF